MFDSSALCERDCEFILDLLYLNCRNRWPGRVAATLARIERSVKSGEHASKFVRDGKAAIRVDLTALSAAIVQDLHPSDSK